MDKKRYYLYILLCSNHSYYTGYTVDINRRYQEHLDRSTKCKYTRSFPPLAMAACWSLTADLSAILRIEREIKKLPKKAKQHLVHAPMELSVLLEQTQHPQDVIASMTVETDAFG